MTLPSESTRSTRSVEPPALPCASTESTIDKPKLHLDDADPRSVIANDSRQLDDGALGRGVGGCLARALTPTAQAVCHQPSSLWTKSDDREVVTALYPYSSVTITSAMSSFGRRSVR